MNNKDEQHYKGLIVYKSNSPAAGCWNALAYISIFYFSIGLLIVLGVILAAYIRF